MNENLFKLSIIKGVFDLLKNKGMNRTTLTVLCLILKLFLELDKLGPNDQTKLKFLSPTEPRDNFLFSAHVP
jgi:hypothetical protein